MIDGPLVSHYSSSLSVECLCLDEEAPSFVISVPLTAVASDSYDGGRSSSNRMDRSVPLLLLPVWAKFDLTVFDRPTSLFTVPDRLTGALLSRSVPDRLTEALLPCCEPDLLTVPSGAAAGTSAIDISVPLRLRPPVGCSYEKAVLLLLRPWPPATMVTLLA